MGNRKPYLDAVTFHYEGAYRAHDPHEAAAYGYNITNFLRDAPATWRGLDKHDMHPQVVSLMNRIAAGGQDARHAAEQLFSGVGQRTQAFMNGRTNDIPINHNADTITYLDSVKRIIRPLTEQNYNRQFGLGAIRDEYTRHEAMDSIYIRPHSGVWSIVYAAKHAGILSDAQATAMGYKYITPLDANIPAVMSGNPARELPSNREQDRGKGRAYLSLKPELAELINHATPQQMQAMHFYMHEARVKYFSNTVEAERIMASYGDEEGAKLYAAHTKTNPTEGWIARADASLAYYHPAGMQRALQQAAVQVRPAQDVAKESSWIDKASSVACSLTGFFCAAEAKAPRQR